MRTIYRWLYLGYFFLRVLSSSAVMSMQPTTSKSDGGGLRQRRGNAMATHVEPSYPRSTPPAPKNHLPKYEAWDDIVSSAVVVNGLEAATSRVAPRSPPSLAGTLRLVARFWMWNLPLVLKGGAALGAVYLTMSYYQMRGGGGEDLSGVDFPDDLRLRSIGVLVQRIMTHLGFSSDSNELSMFGVVHFLFMATVKFVVATVVLFVIRVCQRLLWYTTEFGTYGNVKDETTYQDEKLLDKAWARGYQSCGWHDPTTADNGDDDDAKGASRWGSSPQVMFQPREGYCGIASFNSALRTFLLPLNGDGASAAPPDEDDVDGAAAGASTETWDKDDVDAYCGDDPYVRLHSLPRYVTLEEAYRFFHERLVGVQSPWNDASASTAPIVSAEMVGGGKRGFPSHGAFVRALKQMNHPTQPARVLAIYGRSPLFFCHRTGVGGAWQKVLTFGMGHWSPIVSYLEEEDLVLVMDVNRKYGPRGYLVPSRRMYDAVNTRCIMTGNYRGLILLRGPPKQQKIGNNNAMGSSGCASTTNALLMDETELSRALGNMKEAYYHHIATNGKGVGEMSLTVDELIIQSNDANKTGYLDEAHCVRWVTLCDDDDARRQNQVGEDLTHAQGQSCSTASLRAVLSLHPMTFTNTCFLPRQSDGSTTAIDASSLERDVKHMMDAFKALRVPMTVAVRGCPDRATYSEVHKILCSAGLAPVKRGTTSFYLNLLPEDKGSFRDVCSLPPDGFEIHELKTASTSARDAGLIRQWGHVVADSYGFKRSLIRHGRSPGQFLGDAYQVVPHGDHLRQFVCIQKKTDSVVACSTLYHNPDVDPRVACMFNVCVLKEYRGLKLGKIMSRCVIAEAANAGCTQVVLEASPKGQPVYERLGFVASKEDWGGMYVRIGIATESWRWKVLFKMLETAMWIKNR